MTSVDYDANCINLKTIKTVSYAHEWKETTFTSRIGEGVLSKKREKIT